MFREVFVLAKALHCCQLLVFLLTFSILGSILRHLRNKAKGYLSGQYFRQALCGHAQWNTAAEHVSRKTMKRQNVYMSL